MAGPRTLARMFPNGLSGAGEAEAFGRDAQTNVIRRWHNLTPAGRFIELVRLANQHLATAGVPAITPQPVTKTTTAGEFDQVTWQIHVDPTPLRLTQPTRDEAAEIVETIYHEARHAEQFFRMAQLRAEQGLSTAGITAEMAIPPQIAERATAAPLTPGSMQAVIAQGWFDSVYGPGRPTFNAVETEAGAAAAAKKAAKDRLEANRTPANEAAYAAALVRLRKAEVAHNELPVENDAEVVGRGAQVGVTLGAPDPVTDSVGAPPASGPSAIEPLDGALRDLLGEAAVDTSEQPVGVDIVTSRSATHALREAGTRTSTVSHQSSALNFAVGHSSRFL